MQYYLVVVYVFCLSVTLLSQVSGWYHQTSGTSSFLNDVYFFNEFNGILVGDNGTILHTIDGGENWVFQESNTTRRLLTVFFVNDNIGWAVGEYGTIIKTVTGGITNVKNESTNDNPSVLALYQNYPNPFNPTTTISYQIPELSSVSLKVYDVLGKEITTLVNEEKPIGRYEITFNVAELPSGIYFYQLRAGSFVEIKKMILLK